MCTSEQPRKQPSDPSGQVTRYHMVGAPTCQVWQRCGGEERHRVVWCVQCQAQVSMYMVTQRVALDSESTNVGNLNAPLGMEGLEKPAPRVQRCTAVQKLATTDTVECVSVFRLLREEKNNFAMCSEQDRVNDLDTSGRPSDGCEQDAYCLKHRLLPYPMDCNEATFLCRPRCRHPPDM